MPLGYIVHPHIVEQGNSIMLPVPALVSSYLPILVNVSVYTP
jgi:hypothetical protein